METNIEKKELKFFHGLNAKVYLAYYPKTKLYVITKTYNSKVSAYPPASYYFLDKAEAFREFACIVVPLLF